MYETKERLTVCGENPCELEDKHCESILDAFGVKERKKIKIAKETYGVSKAPCIYVSIDGGKEVKIIDLFEESQRGYCNTVTELMRIIAPYVNSQEYDIEITGF